MPINIITTDKAVQDNGIKMLVYGRPGVGKTTLCATAPKPIILSAESGLLSLRKHSIPVIEIKTMQDLFDAYSYLMGPEGVNYETVCLDSISEIAEVVLANAKKASKDPRQAYGELLTQMQDLIRSFRDMPRFNVYFSAKEEYSKDEMGIQHYIPSMPGSKLGPALPYFFDEVFRLMVGEDENKNSFRYLSTRASLTHEAKDRSGALEPFEAADLTSIIFKIKGAING